MLNKKESYVEIWGGEFGARYGQNQDDGTGRLVRRDFTVDGWEIDPETGKIIDPEWTSPEAQEKASMEKAAADEKRVKLQTEASRPLTWGKEPELMVVDRIKITDPSNSAYLEAEDIQAELKKLDVSFHHKAGREKLMKILKQEMKLPDGVETRRPARK